MDAKKAIWDASKKIYDTHNALIGSDGDAATWKGKVKTALTNADTAKKTVTSTGKTWSDKGKDAVAKWATYKTEKDKEDANGANANGYTKSADKNLCKTGAGGDTTLDAEIGSTTAAQCLKKCTALPAWDIEANTSAKGKQFNGI